MTLKLKKIKIKIIYSLIMLFHMLMIIINQENYSNVKRVNIIILYE